MADTPARFAAGGLAEHDGTAGARTKPPPADAAGRAGPYDRRDMLAQWRQAMSDTFVPLSVSCSDPARFSGSSSTDHVGVLKVTSLSSSAQHIDRTPALIARSEPDLWQIALSRGGGIRLDHDGRQVRLKPGDFVAYETA